MVESWTRGLFSLNENSQLRYESEIREQRIVLRSRTGLNGGERGFFCAHAVRARSLDGHKNVLSLIGYSHLLGEKVKRKARCLRQE